MSSLWKRKLSCTFKCKSATNFCDALTVTLLILIQFVVKLIDHSREGQFFFLFVFTMNDVSHALREVQVAGERIRITQ